MNNWIRRFAMGLTVLIVLGALVAITGKVMGERKRTRVVNVPVTGVMWATDTASLERGRYLYLSRGCTDCHHVHGGGREFINDPKGLRIIGPNITMGGPVAKYSADDWTRILRHGVKADGRAAFVMPSEDYARWTNADVAALVGYVRSLPPISGGEGIIELPTPVKALYGFGMIQDAFEKIDHTLPPAQPLPAAVNAPHGAYVANMCIGCHGPGLSGGKIPGGPPSWPAASNLTPGAESVMARYPDAPSFVAMLRSGKRADGSTIQVMPFESLRELNDVDAQALYAYLKTIPAKAPGNR